MPTWCSAAIEAGMSFAFLMALIRPSSGAIGLAPSRSTAASSSPAGPEIAEQFLHVALWSGHRRVEQVELLLPCPRPELFHRRNRGRAGGRAFEFNHPLFA
jgi:hypothetical protein